MYIGRMDLDSKGSHTKLFYQMFMLFIWGTSTGVSTIMLSKSLPDYWKNFVIFIWDLSLYFLPIMAYTTLNMICHLIIMNYNIYGVSEKKKNSLN